MGGRLVDRGGPRADVSAARAVPRARRGGVGVVLRGVAVVPAPLDPRRTHPPRDWRVLPGVPRPLHPGWATPRAAPPLGPAREPALRLCRRLAHLRLPG